MDTQTLLKKNKKRNIYYIAIALVVSLYVAVVFGPLIALWGAFSILLAAIIISVEPFTGAIVLTGMVSASFFIFDLKGLIGVAIIVFTVIVLGLFFLLSLSRNNKKRDKKYRL